MDLELFLKKVPLFSSIPDSQIRKIAACFHVLDVKKDVHIFEQGDLSDAMYIIRSGAVFIYSEKQGRTPFQVELQRGDFFGEMALLSNLPRSATAKVTLDATLFCLKKENFKTLLTQNRHIGLFLSRLYARRLSFGSTTESTPLMPIFYTVSATDPDLGLSHFLYSMSYHISTESDKKVLVVEPHLELKSIMKKFDLHSMPCPDISLFNLLPSNVYASDDIKWFNHPSGFCVLQVNKGFHEQLVSVLPQLMESFKFKYDRVIFSLTHHFDHLEQQAVRLCDKNLLIINNTPAALPGVKKKLDRLEQTAGIGLDRVRVGVSHLCGATGIPRETLKRELNLSETPQVWVEKSDKAIKDQIDTEKRFPVKGARAIARELAGVRIGLALGAGAARGWSHIGVLKVFEEEGIHIDMIAGTSMGALVGAIYASKGSVEHLMEYTIKRLPTRSLARKNIFDYTLPLKGFLRGRKAMNLVSTAVNNADFMDLLIPTYIVGVDILKGEEVLFDTGDVSRAVRSSLSLPAVFVPFRHNGRWMVDGGLLNPVPVNILEQKGADKIIAVCVENPNSTAKQTRRSPSIMQVIFRTINIVHSTATTGFAQKSDVVVYPEAQDFAWDDFHKGNVLMQRGENACKKVLKEIKALIKTPYK
ncbi:MAG: patatin-like phospholipase family protein [Desulfobacula sp.]|nr:patatin-like phospholipase family protein [Desulfobacula sp.]